MSDSASPEPASRPADSGRPRPQYGEYATPEEQRARIQQPAPWQLETAGPVMTDLPDPAPAPGHVAPVPPEPRRRPVDRIVTIALLAYGLINVVTSVPAFLDYSAYADMMLGMLGVDAELSDPAGARGWAIAAALVLVIGWAITAALSVWSLRRGRLTWWIPLTAGIVVTFVAGALMAAPLLGDPAIWQALVDSGPGLG
ncbi:DUF6264 family protein [Microbacterium sp. M3]|uniref:DUF6264 family protein n=1 Tax=Microbacterium arthrosphaerae TaxID=792652 RepID=A0ABU4GVW3_9MICO|nr:MULTISPECIES: DUF6264 family protein [Microbacterium]MDW4571209.1 DUF6264 family protein [Microbacterium arthrosphaerae]MDW7605064.1 DUF6264 family protein [Microbacterium sp. M3]